MPSLLTKPFAELTRQEAEDLVRDAESILRAEYWQDVRNAAESIRDELRGQIKDGVTGEPLREWLIEHVHETIDGSQRVIYTWEAQKCVLFSDNDGAYAENFGTDGMVEDGMINWSRLAYAAFEADVIEELTADVFDDPSSDESKEALGIATE